MLKLTRYMIPMALLLAGFSYSQDLGSEPAAASSAYGQEPASISYQDLKAEAPADSVDNEGSPVAEEPLTVEESQESVPVKKKVLVRKKEKAYSPKNDPEYLRNAGTNQHSKGVTVQFLGGGLLAAGIIVMAINADGFSDATDDGYNVSSESEQSDSSNAALGFVVGEFLTIGGVACLVVGGIIRSMGTNKMRRADQLEEASLFDRHRVKVIPVASVDRRMGGLVVAGNF